MDYSITLSVRLHTGVVPVTVYYRHLGTLTDHSMSLIAEITLEDPILFVPTFDAVPSAECHIENFHYLSDPAGNTHYVFFWWVTGTTFPEYEDALAADPTVSGFHQVTSLTDKALYCVVTKSFPPEQPLVFPFFRDHDTTVIQAIRSAKGLELQARFPNRSELKSFLSVATDIADEVHVTRLYTEKADSSVDDVLTDKQREALTIAYEKGYFESPAHVSLEELAEDLDITAQSLSARLRRAINHVVSNTVTHDAT